MGMIIRAELFPIRLKLSEKNNFELLLEVENEDDKKKLVTVELQLPPQVSFSNVSLSTDYSKRVEGFRPLGKMATKMPIYMSRNVEPGNHSGKIIVQEHFREFGVVEKKFRKEILFRIYE